MIQEARSRLLLGYIIWVVPYWENETKYPALHPLPSGALKKEDATADSYKKYRQNGKSENFFSKWWMLSIFAFLCTFQLAPGTSRAPKCLIFKCTILIDSKSLSFAFYFYGTLVSKRIIVVTFVRAQDGWCKNVFRAGSKLQTDWP